MLSSQELTKLLKDSENFTIQINTENGSLIQVRHFFLLFFYCFSFVPMIISEMFFPFRSMWKDLHGLSLCTLFQCLFHQLKMIWTWDICCVVFASCTLCVTLHLGILDLSRCFCCLFKPISLCKELFIVVRTDHTLSVVVPFNVLVVLWSLLLCDLCYFVRITNYIFAEVTFGWIGIWYMTCFHQHIINIC